MYKYTKQIIHQKVIATRWWMILIKKMNAMLFFKPHPSGEVWRGLLIFIK
jgi:hypothetical protein